MFLNHLIDYVPSEASAATIVAAKDAPVSDIVAAQLNTAEWLKSLDVPLGSNVEKEHAREAFGELTTTGSKETLLALKDPVAVQHLSAMLTQYDWEFVNRAKEIRGYVVAQIMEETKHKDARVRLRALEMLGKVTEVALFTDRVEIKRTELSDTELDTKIKEKLARLTGVIDAYDISDAKIADNGTADA